MSPEVYNSSRNKRDMALYQEDNFSKFSDEKRSTLPLHSDSFKKHSPEEEFVTKERESEIMDTEKRNQNKEFTIESPHFLEEMKLASSNPFMPCNSQAKSLEYESTPPKDSKPDPMESLRVIILENINKFGKERVHSLLSEFILRPRTQDKNIQCDNSVRSSMNIRQLQSENEKISAQLSLSQESNKTLKEKCDFYSERATTLDKLLRERESKILHLSTELENATLMEGQLKKEIEALKSQREEIEKNYKELKLSRGMEAIQIRQLKSDIESKKREIIDASDLIDRVTNELKDIKGENKVLEDTIEKLEKEKFNTNLMLKKLERELYKNNCEKKKLNSVIQMQKDSLNELQKDYYNSQGSDNDEHIKRTFDHHSSHINQTYSGDSTVVFNSGPQQTFYNKNSTKDKVMHSFDNLGPFETKTFYDQVSPFSSTRTLNNFQKINKNSFTNSIEKDMMVKTQIMKNNSESQKAINENTVNISETEFYYPDDTINTERRSQRNNAKNMSCSSNKFLHYLEKAKEASQKPLLKYSKNKYNSERNNFYVNSPISESEAQSFTSMKNSSTKKGKIKILNKERSRQISRATEILLSNNISERSPKK